MVAAGLVNTRTALILVYTAQGLPLAVFILVGWSNAVNLTDGLDGLAVLRRPHLERLRHLRRQPRGCDDAVQAVTRRLIQKQNHYPVGSGVEKRVLFDDRPKLRRRTNPLDLPDGAPRQRIPQIAAPGSG